MSKKKFAKSMERKSIKQRITGISKKKIVSMAILAMAVIAIIIAIVVNQLNAQKLRRNESAIDSESVHAMTKAETAETENNDSNGISLYASDTSSEVKEWAKVMGGTLKGYNDEINSVAETSDGGCIAGGQFWSTSLDLGNGIKFKNKGTDQYNRGDGIIIKYNSSGEIEWAKQIGGSGNESIMSVKQTSDGGYIVAGMIRSSSISLENGVNIYNHASDGTSDGMLIKYNSRGVPQWARVIGGSRGDYIYSAEETTDGGYLVGGVFESNSISLGNGVSLTNTSTVESNVYPTDGMIIKYNNKGIAQWIKGLESSKDAHISKLVLTSDGGFFVAGYFGSGGSYLHIGDIWINNTNYMYTFRCK